MFKKVTSYLKNVKIEMGKVSWPSREVLFESTGITLVLAFMMAVFIFFTDQVVSRIINIIL